MRLLSAGVIFCSCMTMTFSIAKTESIIETLSPAKNEEQINFLLPSQTSMIFLRQAPFASVGMGGWIVTDI